MKLTVKVSECSCEKCSKMCHAPCCGTPDDMQKLIDAGYGERLMYDDLPGGEYMIKPALKGFEGEGAPWEVASKAGCTFWKDGKCELHESGLKPLQGKLALHGQSEKEIDQVGDFINEAWQDEKKTNKVIKKWKKLNKWPAINDL